MSDDALRENERLLRQIIDLVPHFIFAKDRDGRFILVNKAVAEAYGTTVEELSLKTDADFARSDEEVRHFRADDLAVIDSGRPKHIPDEQITDATGTVRSLATVKIPFTFSGSAAPAVLGVSVDITEKKALWEAAQRAQRIESLGVLAGGIAHDFNNLLGGVFGHMDLARAASRDPKVIEHLDGAMRALGRARGLTRQLLTFAKGGAPARRTGSLVPVVCETAQFTLSGSNVSFRLVLPDDLWLCDHDPDQIGQVFNNILINAQQAMPAGGTVEISGRNLALEAGEHPLLPQGRYVRVSFRDQGAGIPADVLPMIFDPFFTTKQKGSGLGLAISYSIVARHGGCIDVESEPDRGSIFHVSLPASSASQASDERAAASTHHGQGRMLVMDDEELILGILAPMLEHLGYAVTCVRDGKEAVRAFVEARGAGRPFAGALLDLTVPGGMGGREAVRELRARDAAIPIFVLSGYAEDPVMADPGRYGFTGSISKPFTMSDLERLLETHMGAKAPS